MDERDSHQQLTNHLEIFNLLKRVQKSKQSISISFTSLPQHSLTALIDIHHEEKILVFDEPNPAISSQLVNVKNEAEFSLKLDNIPVVFTAEFITSNINTNRLYTFYPEKIYYPQNRHYYRFNTAYSDDVSATIFLSSTQRLPCKLKNISADGLCLLFPYTYARMFKLNQVIDDIYIQLPDENGFSISAKVQNSRIENNYENVAIGLQIYKQEPRIEKTIQKFIFRSENH